MKPIFLVIFFNVFCETSYSQEGLFDSTFGIYGKVLTNNGLTYLNKIIVQKDDKFIAVGGYYKNSNADFGIIRYNSNGSIDDQYGLNGIQNIDFGLNDEMANDFCLFSNNKTILVGNSTQTNSSNHKLTIVKLNSDGSIDDGFGVKGKLIKSEIDSLKLSFIIPAENERFYIAGSGGSKLILYKFNSNGTFDSSFNKIGYVIFQMPNKIKTYELRKLIKQEDGKLILFGQSNIVNNDVLNIIRYNPNGSIDSTFGKNGIIYGTDFSLTKNCYCNAAISIENNELMINVVLNGFNGLLKLKNNGLKDSSFGIDGMRTTNINSSHESWDMIQDNKGRFICVGGLYISFKSKNFVMRFKKNGYLDSSFSMDGYDTFSIKQIRGEQAVSVAFQKNGSILVGSFIDDGNSSFAFGIVRYRADNTLKIRQINYEPPAFKIYPNPIINEFYLEFLHSQERCNLSLDLHDQNGKLLHSFSGDGEILNGNPKLKFIFPDKFTSGNYILNLRNKNEEGFFHLRYMK